MVFRAVPLFYLQRDFAGEVRELQLWLELVWKSDPDRMCAQLAGAALATLANKAADAEAMANRN